MKQSRRSRRMERSHKRHKGAPAFNLVSLMDIFTILVFFLLVNSSDGEVLPSTRSVDLPESIAEQKPRHNVIIMVTPKDIIVQGEQVALVADVVRNQEPLIEPLRAALQAQQQRRILQEAAPGNPPPEVTIMGGKQIPYALLKKVMASCTDAGYGRISLAVMQKAPQEG